MLRTSFHDHPAVIARTELFNPDWNRKEPLDESLPARVILSEQVYRDYPARVEAVGFALHRSGARFGQWPTLWSLLESDTEIHVISLRRNNLLRRYISHCVMRERNRSGQGKAYIPPPRRYQPKELQSEFERAEKETADFDQRFAAHPLLPVPYEQLCDDYVATLRRIQVFLGVRARAVAPHTDRNPTPPLDQLISNFEELARAFADTRWAWYFREATPGKARGTDAQRPLSARCEVTLAPSK